MLEPEVIAISPKMRNLVGLLDRVAHTDANLLICGESGTGKDLLAEVLHYRSSRRSGQIVKIDCATLPDELLESELFGYERGAFTGAVTFKPGRLETAAGGTLVLDEILHLGLQNQAKLLRVIEERSFMRLGGTHQIHVDARLVVLSRVELSEAVEKGLLRADLFHRFNVVSIYIPPLRERVEDLPALLKMYLRRASARHDKRISSIDHQAMRLLLEYDYPGNVREMQNILERAVILATGDCIELQHLPEYLISARRLISRRHSMTLAELEAIYIQEVLLQTRGHKTKAAEILGISRKNLYEKIKKYGIKL